MKNRVSIAKVSIEVVAMAADFALEQRGGECPGDAVTPIRVGYLRRVPDLIEPVLIAAWPHGQVEWVTKFERGPSVVSHPGGLHFRRSVMAAVVNRHVVYPLCLLESFIEFLRPTGSHHLATLDVPVSLNPESVVRLEPRAAAKDSG